MNKFKYKLTYEFIETRVIEVEYPAHDENKAAILSQEIKTRRIEKELYRNNQKIIIKDESLELIDNEKFI